MRRGGRARTGDGAFLTERQAIAIEFEAMIEERGVAELRRRAVEEYADRLLADPAIAEMVRLCVRSRAEQGIGPLRLVAD